MSEALRNQIMRDVTRALDRRSRRVPCLVDSYSPQLHAVKVKLLPEGTLSGWVSIQPLQTGNNFGFHVAPNINDPGWLEFHEADRRAPVFVGSAFNDQFKPVQIQAGELLYRHKSGSSLYFKNDGTVTVTDKGGNTIATNGTDTITLTAAKIVLNGTVYLGGADASLPVSAQGTRDSRGDADVSGFLTKVFGK